MPDLLMKKLLAFLAIIQIAAVQYGQIIDHTCTNLSSIPVYYIERAKASLSIVYEHTSHGSQIIDGMTGLYNWKGSLYTWNNGGINGALDIHDHGITGGSDLGSPDWTSWASSTRSYLRNPANYDVNVVMWAWCGQVSTATESNIRTYLSLMSSLETEFPLVKFVYMTGHLDGTGVNGNLNLRNEQIRNYCRSNNKLLFDFADIESYDPDNVFYLNRRANDNCDYDSDSNGSLDKNWAISWQSTHTVNTDWYWCNSAHSQPLNANRKAYAAWWMFARLAGWSGPSSVIPVTGISVTPATGSAVISTVGGTLQLNAAVYPSNATNRNVVWSVTNNTGQAIISPSGLVTAVSAGTVTACATAADGSGISASLTITITLQSIPVTAVTVSGAGGASSIAVDNGSLQLIASVYPSNATNKLVAWTIMNISGEASVSSSGNVTASADGIVVVKATALDGSGCYGTLSIEITNQHIPVQSILINTESGLNTIPEIKGSLQLSVEISPAAATIKDVNWSIENITGEASINQTGLVTAIDEGIVNVIAEAADGTGIKATLELDIKSKRGEPLYAIIQGNEIRIPLEARYTNSWIGIYDFNGTLVLKQKTDVIDSVFDSSGLKPGIYFIVLSNSVVLRVGKFIIPG
jgi:uncharacterized protein YjdB